MNHRATPTAPVRRFLLLFGLWLLLTGGRSEGWPFGLAAAALATAVSRGLTADPQRLRAGPLFRMVPRFLLASVLGGWDVAWRALHPRRPLAPGWVEHHMRLPAGAPRVVLAGEISLQPGTLVAGARGDHLLVHYLDRTKAQPSRIEREEARIAASLAPAREAPR